jgi:hypothetical protein
MNKKDKYKPIATITRKKDFVKVHGYLDLRTTPPIELEIKATPDDWESFQEYLFDIVYQKEPPKQLLNELRDIAYCAMQSLEQKKPRGEHKRRGNLEETLKTEAGLLYPFLKYWCGKSLKDWPEPLKSVVDMALREHTDEILRNGNKYDAKILTAYCVDKVHGIEGLKLGLKRLFEHYNRESFENFYYTYIKGTSISAYIEKKYIKSKQPQEIEGAFNSLLKGKYPEGGFDSSELALRNLFQALKLV